MASTIATPAPLAGAVAEPERRASWLELFFDLCFVVAVGAVAHTLHDETDDRGIVLFAAMLSVLAMGSLGGSFWPLPSSMPSSRSICVQHGSTRNFN